MVSGGCLILGEREYVPYFKINVKYVDLLWLIFLLNILHIIIVVKCMGADFAANKASSSRTWQAKLIWMLEMFPFNEIPVFYSVHHF